MNEAKNAFGLELKYTATCTFEPGNPNGEIVVKERLASWYAGCQAATSDYRSIATPTTESHTG